MAVILGDALPRHLACWPATCTRTLSERRDGARRSWAGRVRRRHRPLLRPPGRHRRHPRSWPPTPPTPTSRGCRRSSPRTASCPASCQPGRPARVLERHPRPRRRCRAADRRLRRHHHRPHPALRGRRVHVGFTLSPARHGPPPPPRSASRAGRRARSINARRVRSATVHRADGGGRSRSSPIGAWVPVVVIPADRRAVQGDQTRTTTGWPRRLGVARRLAPAAHEPHGRRPGRRRAPGRARGAGLRPVAGARTTWSPSPWSPTRRSRSASRSSGTRTRSRHAARDRLLALPGADPAGPAASSTRSTPARRTTSSPWSSPSSSSRRWWEQLLHNQSALCPEGPAPLPGGHGGHVGAVSTSGPEPPASVDA